MTRPDVLWGSKGRSSHGQDSEIDLVVPKLATHSFQQKISMREYHMHKNADLLTVRNIRGLQYIGAGLQYIGAPKFYFQYSGVE